MRLLTTCLLLAATLACEPVIQPPGDPAVVDTLVSEDVGDTVASTVGPTGGVVETTQGGVTYRLTVPAGALQADIAITLTPARLVGVDGAVGARLEPGGTTFLIPATLLISPPPAGDILVAIQDGQIPVEAELAIPIDGAVLLPVAHFSTHSAADARAVLDFLPADVRQRVEALAGQSQDALAALGLGDFYRTHVEPLLALSTRDVAGFEIAAGAFLGWTAAIELVGDTGTSPHTLGGPESVATLRELTTADLSAAGLELMARITKPSCVASADIVNVVDWAAVPQRLADKLNTLGIDVLPATCLTPRVTVVGPETMDADTTELHLTLTFEVVAPPPDNRAVFSDASFSLDALGASGPTAIEDGNGGNVRDVVFEREVGPDRARVVTITANAFSADAQLGLVPEPEPAVFVVAEPGTELTVSASPTLLVRSSETAEVCSTVSVKGAPVEVFTVNYTLEGPGSLDTNRAVTNTGRGCVVYAPPVPLPQDGGQAIVRATASVAGGQLQGSTVIDLGGGGMQIALASTPGVATVEGESLAVCATVTSDGAPVTSYELEFSLSGPGQLSETALSVTSQTGEICIEYVAPTPLVTGVVATISGRATAAPFTAAGVLAIPLEEPQPVIILSTNQVRGDRTICGGAPNQNLAVATVMAPDTSDPIANAIVTFLVDGIVVTTTQTDTNGNAFSERFPASVGTHLVEAVVGSARAEFQYLVFEQFSCQACDGTVCSRAPFDPPTRVRCGVNDQACSNAARCSCSLEGCRVDGAFNVEFDPVTGATTVVEIHCRSQG
jgi:hypothetical protein